MTRAELVHEVAKQASVSLKDATNAVDAVMEQIIRGVQSGHPVTLRGFGTFKIRVKAGGTRRNPRTGEEIEVDESKTVKFVPSKDFVGRLN